jgi:uncharacterized protein (DUF362 family)
VSKQCHKSNDKSAISRRDFLRLAGLGAASLFVGSCQSQAPTTSPVASSPGKLSTQVAVNQVRSYDRETIETQVRDLIENLGGLSDVVKSGDSVAIKTNLTGGVESGTLRGVEPVDSFVTHPEVVRALVNAVKAAGAGEIFIVEAVYEWESYRFWGYEEIAEDTGATLIDLNDFKPYKDFREDPVGADNFIYEKFIFNPIINDVDVFMSVSKMKNHYLAGVTHTMKNLYGLVPYRFYRLNESDEYRSGFHGLGNETRNRLPSIIVDLNRARPINFSLVDGIKSSQGGEGPWIDTLSAIEPGLLVAGKNSVATDTVATALMGHDPMGEYPNTPYVRCNNHLNIAASLGLGTNRLDEIEVIGQSIETVKVNYSPGW